VVLVVSRVLHPAPADPRFAFRNMGQTKRRRKGREGKAKTCTGENLHWRKPALAKTCTFPLPWYCTVVLRMLPWYCLHDEWQWWCGIHHSTRPCLAAARSCIRAIQISSV
jgi:hypothetical protein